MGKISTLMAELERSVPTHAPTPTHTHAPSPAHTQAPSPAHTSAPTVAQLHLLVQQLSNDNVSLKDEYTGYTIHIM